MWLLIDGYNVLKSNSQTAPLKSDNLREERENFIRCLVRYRRGRKDKVTVVFDGFRGENDSLEVQKQEGLEIIYSRRGQTADEVIKCLVEEADNPRNVMVVSSDREISSFVKSLGASTSGARSLADRLEFTASCGGNDSDENSQDLTGSAYHFERYVKGYRKEEDLSLKKDSRRKGKKYRRRRARSSLKLWK